MECEKNVLTLQNEFLLRYNFMDKISTRRDNLTMRPRIFTPHHILPQQTDWFVAFCHVSS